MVYRCIFALFLALLLGISVVAADTDVCPVTVYEGQPVQLDPEAYDPDMEIGPAGKLLWSFSRPFDDNGLWQTRKGDSGIRYFFATVSDGQYSDTRKFCVNVLSQNRDPVLDPLPEIAVTIGENFKITPSCYDPDGDAVFFDYEFKGHPVAFISYDEPGDYPLKVICSDGFGGMDSKTTMLHVLEKKTIIRPVTESPVVLPVQPINQDIEVVFDAKAVKKVQDLVVVMSPVEIIIPGPESVDIISPPQCEQKYIEQVIVRDVKNPCGTPNRIEIIDYPKVEKEVVDKEVKFTRNRCCRS